MVIRTIIFIILSTLIQSCNTTIEQKEIPLKEAILGDWEEIYEEDEINNYVQFSGFGLPQGMSISKDSIDFYLGFFKNNIDSITGKKTRNYLGNNVPYKTKNESIFIKNPLTELWEFKWKFVSLKNDTLELYTHDSTQIKYKKLNYNLDVLVDFDQIIFSSSGCYGTCPIIDISIDKSGHVLFQGEGYVKSLGFYTTLIEENIMRIIFDKFRKANPLELLDNYEASHTDDQSLTTTFIKNGQIIKTIHDYGMVAPKELIWAYIPISNIHNGYKLESIETDEPFYPKLHYFTFNKDSLILTLEKSESFYLWTELKKSKQTSELFNSKYNITFSGNYTYFGPDPNEDRQHKYEINSVVTDGRFFKFEFNGINPITYDLGYNFIERNFKPNDFRKPNEWGY